MREYGDVSPSAFRGYAALAGVVAGAAGLAVSHAATMVLSLRVTPLVGVAESIIEITPGGLAESLIQLVGQWDKPLLILGVLLGLLGLSALAGVLSTRRPWAAMVVFAVMAAIAAVALLTRDASGPYDLLPVVLGAATWIVVLPLLTGVLGRRTVTNQEDTFADGAWRASRRTFLARAAVVAGATAMVAVGSELLGRARRGVEQARGLLMLPVTRGAVPTGADLGVEGIEPWRTSNPSFYRIDTALVVPTIDPTEWRLRIHGMVDRELVLSYEDLIERRLTEDWVPICCVSNEVGGDLIGNAWWSGVRIAELLAEAGVSPDADAVLQTSDDGWNCGTPLTALTDDRNAMLAIAMNGEPLPVEHGFPVRMIVPGLYGYVSATKWITDIEVTRFDDITAYWTNRGWAERGPVRTQSRIGVPRPGADLATGPTRVGGYAWAQHTGVAKVEYQLDGGAWQTATLARVPDVDTWVQWVGQVTVTEGEHTLRVRATDESGYTQTPVRRDVVPDGATGWHTVVFSAG